MKVYMVTKERKVVCLKVNPAQSHFYFRNGAYKLDGNAVRLHYVEGRVNPEAELIYVEDNPFPRVSVEVDDKYQSSILEESVLRNALENVISLPSMSLTAIFNKVIDFLSSPKTFGAFTTLFIVLVIVWGILSGGLGFGI